ncbi:LysR family transcriptional regulator [Thiomonas sp.]|jgi:DNA-binding transcriptional LysR family regulator|uniref:LysR family transcriptional regulator n=1 Tax=Thiomonas sp. TaxID=2047785 RepID=UPI00260F1069|nr:LysR family transcriptional regulator [Thiomonas sp.]
MDWDNARVFLAICRQGTLRAAAAELRVDQATVGRRLAALEKSLDVRLFLRTPGGYLPTPAGERARLGAEQMEQAAHRLQREMQGTDRRLSGTVRLACTDTTATTFLIPALAGLHRQHPDVRVVLSVSTQLTNLTRREADLAVRVLRPDSPDLIARHLSRREVGLYASRDYLARHGEPTPGSAFADHDVVIYQAGVSRLHGDSLCGEPIANARVAMEVNTGMMLAQAVRAGLGIGEVPTHLAESLEELVRIWPQRSEEYDLWLVMHRDLHRTARVRAVADAVVDALT